MLNLLVKYAQDHDLEAEPGFAPKTVMWAVECGSDGSHPEVLRLGDPSIRRDPGRSFGKAPELQQPELKAGGEPRAHFLAETCQVAVLYGTGRESADQAEKIRGKHRFFIRLLCGAALVLPELQVAAKVLDDPELQRVIQARLGDLKAKPTDKVTVCFHGRFPLESNVWHDWWREFRRDLAAYRDGPTPGAAVGSMVCLATGDVVAPARTHPKIQGLDDVGGSPMGSPLVGYNQPAYWSFGLQQSANGAVSEFAAAAYRAGLNELLDKHSQALAGAKIAHWFSYAVPIEDDPFAWLAAPAGQDEAAAQKRAADLLSSIKRGERASLGRSRFYALAVSGAAGRVMTRDWVEGQFEDLVESVQAWFEDLAIVNYRGVNLAASPKMETVVTCCLPDRKPQQKYEDWIKSTGPSRMQLWAAALKKDAPIPFSAAARVVAELRSWVLTGTLAEVFAGQSDGGLTAARLHARMGLLKAFHKRKRGDPGGMKPYLNEDHPEVAYHCGRLMAVLSSLQEEALGDVGAGVVQRFYAAASTTPALVLGRLTRNSQFHINKLTGDKPKLAFWYERKIGSIWGRMRDRIPAVLTLEEQSLFALGYYQQLAADRAPKLATGDKDASDGLAEPAQGQVDIAGVVSNGQGESHERGD